MNSKTSRYLRQAGKYVSLGKLTLALEQYLKIHELEPEDTTIMNTIGDLYVRLEDKGNALLWYTKLAESFAFSQLLPNAMATYRKVLKLAPKNLEATIQLARLSEQQGQMGNAKTIYQSLARQKMDLGDQSDAIALFEKVCRLDPQCPQSLLELAQNMELIGKPDDAVRYYLQSANLLADQEKKNEAMLATENVFRIRPQNREIVKAFFRLLRRLNLTARGIEYLNSVGLQEDLEFKLIVTNLLIEEGNLETALQILNENVKSDVAFYEPSVKLLKLLIDKGEIGTALNFLESIFDLSIQMQDEPAMKGILRRLADMDEDNVQILKALTTIMIRTNDKLEIETYFKKIVVLQLRNGNRRDARENLNKLVVYGHEDYYLDVLNFLNEAPANPTPEQMQAVTEKVMHSFENNRFEKEEAKDQPVLALGVTELDLGIGLTTEIEEEFILDTSEC